MAWSGPCERYMPSAAWASARRSRCSRFHPRSAQAASSAGARARRRGVLVLRGRSEAARCRGRACPARSAEEQIGSDGRRARRPIPETEAPCNASSVTLCSMTRAAAAGLCAACGGKTRVLGPRRNVAGPGVYEYGAFSAVSGRFRSRSQNAGHGRLQASGGLSDR